MLTQLTTQMARAVRHKSVLPIFRCPNLEIAATVVQAAKEINKEVAIYFNEYHLGSLTLPMAIFYLKTLAQESNVAVSILCDLNEADRREINSLDGFKNISYCMSWDDAKRTRFAYNNAHVDRIIQTDELIDPAGAHWLVQKCGVVAVCYKPEKFTPDVRTLQKIGDFSNSIKVPFILSDHYLSKTTHGKLNEAMITAIVLNDELSQAYTAGLRAALHDRSIFEPNQYQKQALLAVKDTAQNYLSNPLNI